jgi:glycosyltransferase involved in cell wall biosynthesis
MGRLPANNSISVVIPVYNSAEILPELVRQLCELLPSIATAHEIILVNDGSQDSSWGVISKLSTETGSVCGINMMRNYGQHNALLCGIRAARFETVITMDDDLQHPPAEIPRLLAKLAEGYDVVYGAPRALPHSWWRNIMSQLIKRLLTWVMGVKTFQEVAAFRAFKTNLRNSFCNYQNPNVLLDVLLSWGTTRFASVKVDHSPRKSGVSNYDFRRLFNTAMLVLTGFSTGPLRLASYIGFGFTFFGTLVFLYVVAQYFVAGSVPGFPFLASIISLFSGAQLFALGIIGEYLGRMFTRSMDRPPYVVLETTAPEHCRQEKP